MEDRKRILKMVEEGKISSEEAVKLLDALEDKSPNIESKGRWLKVKVLKKGSQKVNVKIPLKLIKVGVKIGGKLDIVLPEKAKEQLSEKGINIEGIKDLEKFEDVFNELEKQAPMELVNVDDGDEKVIVTIE
jgi:hypothetical protein